MRLKTDSFFLGVGDGVAEGAGDAAGVGVAFATGLGVAVGEGAGVGAGRSFFPKTRLKNGFLRGVGSGVTAGLGAGFAAGGVAAGLVAGAGVGVTVAAGAGLGAGFAFLPKSFLKMDGFFGTGVGLGAGVGVTLGFADWEASAAGRAGVVEGARTCGVSSGLTPSWVWAKTAVAVSEIRMEMANFFMVNDEDSG
jgi:hypothetical protein